jgi:hypothetical protein
MEMQRRELLRWIALSTGCALVGVSRATDAADGILRPATFHAGDIAWFDEVAETILPRTSTPGAIDARVGEFIARYSEACYPPAHLLALQKGVGALDAQMRAKYGVDFLRASGEQRRMTLLEIDRSARNFALAQSALHAEFVPHYFTLVKQLTLLGFFTSEPGATLVARYRPVPGKYRGCVDHHPGEAFWAW